LASWNCQQLISQHNIVFSQIVFTKTTLLSVKVETLRSFLAMVPILDKVSRFLKLYSEYDVDILPFRNRRS
jgi:hypothetical protein